MSSVNAASAMPPPSRSEPVTPTPRSERGAHAPRPRSGAEFDRELAGATRPRRSSVTHPTLPHPAPHVRRDGGTRTEAADQIADRAGSAEPAAVRDAPTSSTADSPSGTGSRADESRADESRADESRAAAGTMGPDPTDGASTATVGTPSRPASPISTAGGTAPSTGGASVSPVTLPGEQPAAVIDPDAAAILATTAGRQQRLATPGESRARLGDTPAPVALDGVPAAGAPGESATAAGAPASVAVGGPAPRGGSPAVGLALAGASANPSSATAPPTAPGAAGPIAAAGAAQPSTAPPDARPSPSGQPTAASLSSAPLVTAPLVTAPLTTATAATTTPTAPASAPFVAPSVVLAQLGPRALAAAVAATHDGLHTISVQLRPAQLGSVQVVATMGAAGLSLSLHAASDATREVLRAAMADLQADLAAGGLADVSVAVSDRAPDQRTGQGTGQGGLGAGPDGAASRRGGIAQVDAADEPTSDLRAQPARPRPGSDRRLDLRV